MLVRFEPAQYSIPDLHFLMENLGKPPVVAFRQPLAPGTHRNILEEALRTVYEHEEIKKAEDTYAWAGIEALTDSIARFLKWCDLSLEMRRRGAVDSTGALITYPSHYVWDEDGRAFKFAVGADAADMVRTEILEDGSRKAFGVTLANPAGQTMPHISDIAPWVRQGVRAAQHDDKVVDEKKSERISNLRCTICDYTQQYDPANTGQRRMAMARMHTHMRSAKVSINRHRVLLNKIGR
jgi:hypothetical protein